MAIKVCFIGGGKMAEALIKGLLNSGVVKKGSMIASEKDPQRTNYIKKTYKIKTVSDNVSAIKGSDVIILAVKPQNMSAVVSGIRQGIRKDQLVISIAAGIRISDIERALRGIAVIRVMPNNPALIGEGISAISIGKRVTKKHRVIAEKIFRSVGDTLQVDEGSMDAVTALSGSGPAFVYSFLNSMIKAGKKLGLSKGYSEKLSIKTILGAIRTVIATGKSSQELIDMVASPGGTTIAGLKVLEKKAFGKAVVNAIMSAAERSRQLSHQIKI